jgi:APA family basic amino acid/polyamine antiporter
MNAAANDKSHLLGFWMCTALVAGNMIGSGIFFLPASLAPYGIANSTAAWLFTASGAVVLALVFAGLGRALPGGSAYACTRLAFGDLTAFIVMWSYWIATWAGNAAIATGSVSYLAGLFPVIGKPGVAPVVTLTVIWLLTFVNVRGTRMAGGVQLVTTILKLVPLFAIAGIGAWLLLRGDARVAATVQAAPATTLGAFTAAATLTLWPLLGFESASVAAERVRDPARVIPRATILATVLAALVYIVASSAVQIVVPAAELAKSAAPFADTARPFFGGAVADALALFAVISGFGALNGWILLTGEMAFQFARDGIFPAYFATQSPQRTPARALYLSSALVTGLVALNYEKSMAEVFGFVILVSSFGSLVLYLVAALGALQLIRTRQVSLPGRTAALAVCAVLGTGYALWAMFGAGLSIDPAACGDAPVCWTPWLKNPVVLGVLLILAGLPVFHGMRRRGAVRATP